MSDTELLDHSVHVHVYPPSSFLSAGGSSPIDPLPVESSITGEGVEGEGVEGEEVEG